MAIEVYVRELVGKATDRDDYCGRPQLSSPAAAAAAAINTSRPMCRLAHRGLGSAPSYRQLYTAGRHRQRSRARPWRCVDATAALQAHP